jgi:dihydroorotate dehydrogenase (fumarate)
LPQLAAQLHEIGADALILFNRFYQPDFDVENLEVRARLELSSPAELQMRLHWTAILAGRVPIPVIVSGGVHGLMDVVKSIMAGANAVQVVSALLKHGPGHLTTLVSQLEQFMEEQDYRSLDQMRGSLSLKHCPNPDAFERTNYLRTLQLWRV